MTWLVFWLMISACALGLFIGAGMGFYAGYSDATHNLVKKVNERLNDGR